MQTNPVDPINGVLEKLCEDLSKLILELREYIKNHNDEYKQKIMIPRIKNHIHDDQDLSEELVAVHGCLSFFANPTTRIEAKESKKIMEEVKVLSEDIEVLKELKEASSLSSDAIKLCGVLLEDIKPIRNRMG